MHRLVRSPALALAASSILAALLAPGHSARAARARRLLSGEVPLAGTHVVLIAPLIGPPERP
jgi:hypothetical protein